MAYYWDTAQSCEQLPTLFISQHCRERFMQRTEIAPEDVDSFVLDAFRWGRRWADFTGQYRRYMLEKCTENGCFPIYFGGVILIFSPDLTVLTCYKPPKFWFDQYQHVTIPGSHNILFRCWRAVKNTFLNRHGSYWH